MQSPMMIRRSPILPSLGGRGGAQPGETGQAEPAVAALTEVHPGGISAIVRQGRDTRWRLPWRPRQRGKKPRSAKLPAAVDRDVALPLALRPAGHRQPSNSLARSVQEAENEVCGQTAGGSVTPKERNRLVRGTEAQLVFRDFRRPSSPVTFLLVATGGKAPAVKPVTKRKPGRPRTPDDIRGSGSIRSWHDAWGCANSRLVARLRNHEDHPTDREEHLSGAGSRAGTVRMNFLGRFVERWRCELPVGEVSDEIRVRRPVPPGFHHLAMHGWLPFSPPDSAWVTQPGPELSMCRTTGRENHGAHRHSIFVPMIPSRPLNDSLLSLHCRNACRLSAALFACIPPQFQAIDFCTHDCR